MKEERIKRRPNKNSTVNVEEKQTMSAFRGKRGKKVTEDGFIKKPLLSIIYIL